MEIEAAKDSNKGNNKCAIEREVSHSGFDRANFLAWEDLRVVLPNFGKGPTKRLLNGLNGYVELGRIMAIMGPSGSGKSTFLDALAGLGMDTEVEPIVESSTKLNDVKGVDEANAKLEEIVHYLRDPKVGTGVTNSLIKAKKAVNKSSTEEIENVPILSTSAVYGVYMAISSNLR